MIQAWVSSYRHTMRPGRLEHGQSLVETALAMLFFLIFMLGLLDLGRLYFVYVALEDSAGEVAVFLSINPTCDEAPTAAEIAADPNIPCQDPDNAVFRAVNAASGYFQWADGNVDVDYVTGGAGVGNTVRVQIRYPFKLWTPIITQIVGDDTLVITATATQTIMME